MSRQAVALVDYHFSAILPSRRHDLTASLVRPRKRKKKQLQAAAESLRRCLAIILQDAFDFRPLVTAPSRRPYVQQRCKSYVYSAKMQNWRDDLKI